MSDKSGTPSSLLDYIGAQNFEAASIDEIAVNEEALLAPEENNQPAIDADANQVALPPESPTEPTPPQAPVDSEKIQLQQRVAELQAQSDQRLAAITLIAQEAKRREDALFEQKIELLTPEEQVQERELRRISLIESENQYLKNTAQAREQAQAQIQDNLDKVAVAHKVIDRLGLPADNQLIMAALMESVSPPEMFAKAERIADVYRKTTVQAAQVAAQVAAQSNVHKAGGEVAPAVPQSSVPKHQGNLIDMMRERQYVAG